MFPRRPSASEVLYFLQLCSSLCSHLQHRCDKTRTHKDNVRKDSFGSAVQKHVLSHEVMVGVAEAAVHIESPARRQCVMATVSSSLSPSPQSRATTQRVVPPAFRVGLPMIALVKRIPHRCVQRFVSTEILARVKLTIQTITIRVFGNHGVLVVVSLLRRDKYKGKCLTGAGF